MRRLAFTAGLLGILAVACSSSDDAPPKGEEMVLYPTTKVIDASSITDIAPDQSTITFGAAPNAKVGDVLLGGIGPKTPSGVLRRVTAVNGTTFTTEYAKLNDAIERGRIRLPATRLRKEGARTKSLHPLDTASESFDQDFTLGVSDVELTKGVTAGASLGFGLGMDLELTIEPDKLAGKLVLSGNESATVDVHALLATSFDEKVPVAVVDFPPIPISVAGVPLVITTELSVSVGVKGSTSVAFDWSATQKANMDVSLEAGTSGITPNVDGNATASADPVKIAGNLDLEAYAELRLDMAVNALIAEAGFHVGARGYVNLHADTAAGASCYTASRGIKGIYGVAAKAFTQTIAQVEDEKSLVGGEFDHGACSSDPLAVTPWAVVIGASDLDRDPRVAVLSDQSVVIGSNKAGVTGYTARLTPGGAPVWENAIEGTVGFSSVTPAATADGTSWVFGTYDLDPMLVHLAADGSRKSATVVDIDSSSQADRLFVASKDGGVLMAGQTLNGGSTFLTWAAKIDESGNVAWSKVYGAMGEPHAIAEANDGGILLAGETVVGPSAALEVMRISPTGDPVFARTYGEGRLYGITSLAGGGMAAAGNTATGQGAVVLRIGDDGGLVWGFSYEDSSASPQEFQANAILERTDGVLVAGRRGFADTADFWAMQVGSDGSLGWSRTYGGAKADEVMSAARTSDNGAVLIGETKSFGTDVTHLLVIRIPPSGAFELTGGSGGVTKNVDGIKKALPGAPTTQAPSPSAFPATAKTAPAEAWPFQPIVANYTKL